MISIQVLFTHTSFMNLMFKSEALELNTWLELLAISFGVLFVVEMKQLIEKRLVKS